MGLFKFAKDAGDKVGDAMTDNWFTNIFKGKDDDKKDDDKTDDDNRGAHTAEKVDPSRVEVERQGERVVLKGRARTQAEAEKMIIASGNRAGVSEVESRIEVEAPGPESTFYEVKSGDTLSKIASAHYGDAMKYPVIFEANRPMLSDPDKIYPGQVLRVPAPQSKVA